jgi:dihydropteroate synthase
MIPMDDQYRFSIGGIEFNFRSRSHIMGILNVTPDSFSDGGQFFEPAAAIAHGIRLVEQGADMLDIGGESTRPGSEPVSAAEETRRVVPVIEKLREKVSVPLSIDTWKSEVADAALRAGATIVNDISGMTMDGGMLDVVARHGATAVVMHMKGTPRTMQQAPHYENVLTEVFDFLMGRVQEAHLSGVAHLIVDPGIGFGKQLDHNLQLMKGLNTFVRLGCPLLVGPSRKSFIGTLLDLPVDERLEGTAAAVTACILRGANIIRVHDVKEMKRVAIVADALKGTVPPA